MTETVERVHGSCVSLGGRAVLLTGGSGSGKSATALAMTALGAVLVSDDQVELRLKDGAVMASCPEGYSGWIEARGIGILKIDAIDDVEVTHVVDLDQTELQRLPPLRRTEILGVEIDLIYGRDNWLLAPGLIALLSGGRVGT